MPTPSDISPFSSRSRAALRTFICAHPDQFLALRMQVSTAIPGWSTPPVPPAICRGETGPEPPGEGREAYVACGSPNPADAGDQVYAEQYDLDGDTYRLGVRVEPLSRRQGRSRDRGVVPCRPRMLGGPRAGRCAPKTKGLITDDM